MDVDQGPSERLVLQRLRNRTMEAVSVLADGDLGVQAVGPSQFFNQFYDVIDDDAPWTWRTWSCFTADEVQALGAVLEIVTVACDATPQIVSAPDLVASGWPSQIAPVAGAAAAVMQARGKFREDAEEAEPSLPG